METQYEMEDNIIQDPEATDVYDITEAEDDFDYGSPRGTVAFVALMLIGYIIYYGIHYVEIFILRGA